MADGHEPFNTDANPEVQRAEEEIPVARPAALPYAAPILYERRQDDLLLLDSSRGAVWADLGLVVAIIVAFEMLLSVTISWFSGGGGEAGDLLPDATATESERTLLLPALAIRAAVVCAVVAAVLAKRGQPARSVGLFWSGLPLNVLVGVGAASAAFALIIAWQMLASWFWSDLLDQMRENAE